MNVASISTAVDTKARRLHATGKVREAAQPSRVFVVQGDTGTHTVLMYGLDGVTCTCQARGTCSHIAAALIQIREETQPVAYDRALADEAFEALA